MLIKNTYPDGKTLTCLQFGAFRIGFVLLKHISLPYNDIKKWIYFKHYKYAKTVECRVFIFAFAVNINNDKLLVGH